MAIQSEQRLAKAIIEAYRLLISERYEYDRISTRYELPSSFTREKTDRLKAFFLDYIYPPFTRRQELNAAFDSLDKHIKNPRHIFRILMDTTGVLLRFGHRLPSIMKAGITALQSFRKASRFEQMMIFHANEENMSDPISSDQLRTLIQALPKREIDQFITMGEGLFGLLYDRKMVRDVTRILASLIKSLERKPHIYSSAEIHGFRLGHELIVRCNQLFESLTKEEQKVLMDTIVHIER
ncbi:MAG: hypothetical protein AAFR14_03735, partial [Bacteroidota bacterium]